MPHASLQPSPQSSPGSDGLYERLRAATAEAHRRLEHDLDWQARVATRAGYRDLLARLRGFHAAYEPAIGAGLSDEGFFGPRRRLARLDADLVHLGLADPRALPAPPVALRGRSEALGALYVLEGSTLGGLVIGQHIARLHGLAEAGLTYYRGRGRATAALWAGFRRELATAPDEAAALRAGIATFEAMRDWLTAPRAGAEPGTAAA